jgi:preprotein translocase subunit SecD
VWVAAAALAIGWLASGCAPREPSESPVVKPADTHIDFSRGILKVVVEATPFEGDARTADELARAAIPQIHARLAAPPALSAEIHSLGGGRLEVRATPSTNGEALTARLARPGRLTMHEVIADVAADMHPAPDEVILVDSDAGGALLMRAQSLLAPDAVASAEAVVDERGMPAVGFKLSEEGSRQFGAATQRLVSKRIAVVVDGVLLTAPFVQSPITGGQGRITGAFSVREAEDLASVLRYPLPARLSVLEVTVAGPPGGAG